MGGCATKPKVLKGDDEFAPIPEPEPVTVKEGYEAKEVVNGEEETKVTTHEEGAKIKGVNEEKVEAEGGGGAGEGDAVKENKPHSPSLSNLMSDQTEQEKEKPVISSEPVEDKEKLKTETITVADASEEKPVTTVADVLTGETEKVVNAEDVKVTEKAAENDQIQEKPVLPESAAPKVAVLPETSAPKVDGEVTESK